MAATMDELGIRIIVDASGISGLNQVTSSIQSSMQRMSSAIADTVKTAAGLVASIAGINTALDVLKSGFNFNSQMQQAQISFETMLGSLEKAQSMIGDLQQFAAETPFEFPDLQAGAKRMLAFGFAAEDILPMLKSVGDAASGLGMTGKEGIDRIVLALGQMKAKGKVSAEEMLQMTEAGIPAWDILAKSIGKTTGEVMKLAENGAIPADKAIQALINGMEERFPNMMAKQSKSFAGMMSTIKDNFNLVLGDIVKPGFEYLANNVLPDVVVALDKFAKTLREAGTAAAFKTIIPPVVVDGVVTASKAIGNAFQFIGQHADIITGSIISLTTAFATLRAITLASTIVTTAHAISLALETGAVALATRGTVAFTLANIAATASTAATILATEGLTAAFTALTVALNLNPIVLGITAAMAAIAGTVYVVYTNWDAFKSWCVSFWNGIVNVVADNVGIIMAAFPGLGVAIYVVYTYWDDAVKLVKDLWNGLCNFLGGIVTVVKRIIDSVAEAWPRFTAAAKLGVANFASHLASLAERFIPDWAKSLYGKIVSLGNALAAKTAEIGNAIRKNLSISVAGSTVSGTADFRRSEDTNTMPPIESSTPPISSPAIDWSGIGGGGSDSKDTSSDAQSAYEIAKQQYEKIVALEDADARRKAVLWQQYLENVQKTEKEAADYQINMAKLTTDAKKEQLEVDRANLEKEIAQGKARTMEAYDNKITLLQREVELTKAGSAERIKAETAVINAQKDKEKYMLEIEKERQERLQQHMLFEIDLDDQKNQILRDNSLITEQQLNQMTAVNEEKRYNIKKDALNEALKDAKDNEKEQEKIKTQLLTLEEQFRAKKLDMIQKTYEEAHKYEKAAIDGLQSGIATALQDILKSTNSLKGIIHNLSQSIIKGISTQWITDMSTKWATELRKMLYRKKANDTAMLASQKASDTAMAASQAAGNTQQIAATAAKAGTQVGIETAKDSTIIASGTTAAAVSVSATQAAIDSMLAMLPVLLILGALSGLLGGSGSSKTSTGPSINLGRNPDSYYTTPTSIALPSFDVGTWSVPHDMLAMVHKGEPIIPAPFADRARAVLSGEVVPAGTAASSNTYHMPITLVVNGNGDKAIESMLKKHGDTIGKIIQKQVRDFKYKK